MVTQGSNHSMRHRRLKPDIHWRFPAHSTLFRPNGKEKRRFHRQRQSMPEAIVASNNICVVIVHTTVISACLGWALGLARLMQLNALTTNQIRQALSLIERRLTPGSAATRYPGLNDYQPVGLAGIVGCPPTSINHRLAPVAPPFFRPIKKLKSSGFATDAGNSLGWFIDRHSAIANH
jgi:hypothetical protein